MLYMGDAGKGREKYVQASGLSNRVDGDSITKRGTHRGRSIRSFIWACRGICL